MYGKYLIKIAELMNDAVCGFYDIYCSCIASLLSTYTPDFNLIGDNCWDYKTKMI